MKSQVGKIVSEVHLKTCKDFFVTRLHDSNKSWGRTPNRLTTFYNFKSKMLKLQLIDSGDSVFYMYL